ncbi:MAG: nicotinate (nicotinamide) nucleotide adenylyltransferase [Flavobacteriales bacterium]|jgi:nicotinate-nucleotide adenylyltransferase|nr:nicotinate (nicotinamide) nucleotide adenylyltransferase [Flavobacteriales bacterium]MBK6550095.1 nicotinate (nicotinamide) nucleotide adenylyltransferase [Flavobacteriales bacterium]MBK6881744.1 nicotinate (nicotinamide) nucleotide adenylyltransferase [Flavobacteriales bacterium]MBK7102605.1 nicotinate (nicotinamide) nucleotide adenylyltransferase [Flavobacteriales bacterium]MBK7113339.1 nicotinate (nicotinamide) nucleotide adenylyltransferase [Flavobacteriales bacterium]
MRIGCLFGTFDPPHKGHVAIAEHMLKAGHLDQVWLVVTPQNPFKKDRPLSPDLHRLAMVRLAVQGKDGLVASGFEIDLPKPNYTADSFRFMRHRWPDHEFSLIIGSDNLANFHSWKDPEEILEHHALLVYPRKGFKEHLAATIYHGHPGVRIIADAPMIDISSTAIRADLSAWRPVEDRISSAVHSYIRQHGLYKP